MRSLAAQARGVRGTDTALDDVIRIVNVSRVWLHWQKPVLVVVARDVPDYYSYLREVFSDVPWAHVVVDRRQRAREERRRPWTIVHAEPVDLEAAASVAPWFETLAVVRLVRWTWNTGWKIGEDAAYQTLPLARG